MQFNQCWRDVVTPFQPKNGSVERVLNSLQFGEVGV
jgi:hypothetical protein